MAPSPTPPKEKTPRKRGPNFTRAEKKYLMRLAKRYERIIESRKIGTDIFQKKTNAWMQISKSYNASSTTGYRTPEQLKHLYENMKQYAKKALTTTNKAAYLCKLEEKDEMNTDFHGFLEQSDKDEDILDSETPEFQSNSDKIERRKNSEDCLAPNVKDNDLDTLGSMDEVDPLSDSFDSATSYLNDNSTLAEHKMVTEVTAERLSEGNNLDDLSNTNDTSSSNDRVIEDSEIQGKPGVLQKKTNYYKYAYFKKKYHNAVLERRRICQDIRLRRNEHLLLVKKLKLEIANLERQK